MWWICDACIEQIRAIRNDRLLQSQVPSNDIVTFNSPNVIHAEMNYDKEITVLKQQIAAIHETIGNVTITEARAHSKSSRSTSIGTPVAQSSPVSSSRLLCGTKTIYDMSDVVYPRVTDDRFWLFFTRLENNVTERDLSSKIISDSLGSTVSTVVKRLVPAWKDPSTMPYVSFKVGIETRFKELALLPSTWPTGICFREFHNYV